MMSSENVTETLKWFLAKLGNKCPSDGQISLLRPMLFRVSVLREMGFHESLTEREIVCLLLIAKGKTMREIADELSVKFSMVDTWYKSIKRKLGSRSIAQAVFEGIRFGYLSN